MEPIKGLTLTIDTNEGTNDENLQTIIYLKNIFQKELIKDDANLTKRKEILVKNQEFFLLTYTMMSTMLSVLFKQIDNNSGRFKEEDDEDEKTHIEILQQRINLVKPFISISEIKANELVEFVEIIDEVSSVMNDVISDNNGNNIISHDSFKNKERINSLTASVNNSLSTLFTHNLEKEYYIGKTKANTPTGKAYGYELASFSKDKIEDIKDFLSSNASRQKLSVFLEKSIITLNKYLDVYFDYIDATLRNKEKNNLERFINTLDYYQEMIESELNK